MQKRPLDRRAVMRYPGVLEAAGLVIAKKKGKYRWNYRDAARIGEIYERWIDRYGSGSAELPTRLRRDREEK